RLIRRSPHREAENRCLGRLRPEVGDQLRVIYSEVARGGEFARHEIAAGVVRSNFDHDDGSVGVRRTGDSSIQRIGNSPAAKPHAACDDGQAWVLAQVGEEQWAIGRPWFRRATASREAISDEVNWIWRRLGGSWCPERCRRKENGCQQDEWWYAKQAHKHTMRMPGHLFHPPCHSTVAIGAGQNRVALGGSLLSRRRVIRTQQ